VQLLHALTGDSHPLPDLDEGQAGFAEPTDLRSAHLPSHRLERRCVLQSVQFVSHTSVGRRYDTGALLSRNPSARILNHLMGRGFVMAQPKEAVTVAGEIGNKIRALRDDRGWSQELLAGLSGLSSESIRRFERGLKSPRAESLMRLAAAFGVRVDDLMPDDYSAAFTRPALEQLGQLLGFPQGKLAEGQRGNHPGRSSSKASNRSMPISTETGKTKVGQRKRAAKKGSPTRWYMQPAA